MSRVCVKIWAIIPILLMLCAAAGCTVGPEQTTLPVQATAPAQTTHVTAASDETPPTETQPPILTDREVQAMQQAPAAIPGSPTVEAPGLLVKEGGGAVVDYSHTEQGYVMVQYRNDTGQKLKVQVKGPSTTYTYNLTPQQWTALPLSDQNGSYQIVVYQNVAGTKYAAVLSLGVEVTLENEFAPFLHSNQYVDYDAAPKTVAKAAQLTGHLPDAIEKVTAIYEYVVGTLSYDKELAASVKSGYLPELDAVLEKKTGICFDYAALMTGMLRSQGIPTKLVVGFAGQSYHAWISVWAESTGWIDGVIYFDGSRWQRMDPTFASSANSSREILEYIGNGENYTAKYFY